MAAGHSAHRPGSPLLRNADIAKIIEQAAALQRDRRDPSMRNALAGAARCAVMLQAPTSLRSLVSACLADQRFAAHDPFAEYTPFEAAGPSLPPQPPPTRPKFPWK